MSLLFPQLDGNIASQCLRPGRSVASTDVDGIATIQTLERLGLITTRSRRYVRCANPGDPDYRERLFSDCDGTIDVTDGDSALSRQQYCPECGEPVETIVGKEQFEEIAVQAIVPAAITSYVGRALSALAIVRGIASLDQGALSVTLMDRRELTVVVLDFAGPRYHSAGLFFSEPVLYVVASPTWWPPPHVLEGPAYLQLAELLSQPEARLVDKVDGAAHPLRDRPSLRDLEAQFDAMLVRHPEWQHFEQRFVPAFFAHISASGERVGRYLGKLKRFRGTILDYFMVPIGGPGNTDMRQISRYEIMDELCQGGLIAEAKDLRESSLEIAHLRRVLWHLETDPTSPRGAVIVLAAEDVPSRVWGHVTELRDHKGFWQIIILTRYMVLELLSELDGRHLLS